MNKNTPFELEAFKKFLLINSQCVVGQTSAKWDSLPLDLYSSDYGVILPSPLPDYLNRFNELCMQSWKKNIYGLMAYGWLRQTVLLGSGLDVDSAEWPNYC